MDHYNFNKKDNIFSISLPCSDLVFTRYLYAKDEVRIALLVAILNKSDDAIFWAYELFYSGFKHEFFSLIWKIYYDFFATLNPSFEQYLLKKHKEFLKTDKTNEDDRFVSSIVQTMLFRPFNTDVFLLRTINELFDIDISYHYNTNNINNGNNINNANNGNNINYMHNIHHWINTEDYRSISKWIFNINHDVSHISIYDKCLDVFEVGTVKPRLMKEFIAILNLNVDHDIILMSRIMGLFSKKHSLKKGRSMYINVEHEDIILHENLIGSDGIKNYNILEKACICGIDDFKHLSLFKLKRDKYNLLEKYRNNWEYHAFFSPLWSQRIRKYKGYPNYTTQKIVFIDDDLMERFYEVHGLEPDEQTKKVQEKSTLAIEKVHNWNWFNTQYKKNGIVDVYDEELEEFGQLEY
jgi:hypothetical protein